MTLPQAVSIPLEHVAGLLELEKISSHYGPIRSYLKGWLLEPSAKKSLRPIFEPVAENVPVVRKGNCCS